MTKENKILELLQRMQYNEFTKGASNVTLTVMHDKECKADNKHTYDSFKDEFEMFEFLNAKSFAWSTVFSDAITEINSRLARIEAQLKEKNDSADSNDSDINIGGF
jgi:hypothetical protein